VKKKRERKKKIKEKKRKRHWKEKSSTVSECANNSVSSGSKIPEDLFNGAGFGSHAAGG